MNEPTWKELIDSQAKTIESLRAENERLKEQAKEITAASENDGVNWYDLGYQHGAVSTLNDDLVKEIDEKTLETQVANTSIDLLNSDLETLRKRCEDLEAALKESMNYWFFGYKSDSPDERESFKEQCRKLLSQ